MQPMLSIIKRELCPFSKRYWIWKHGGKELKTDDCLIGVLIIIAPILTIFQSNWLHFHIDLAHWWKTNDAYRIDFCQSSERKLAEPGLELTTPGLTARVATNWATVKTDEKLFIQNMQTKMCVRGRLDEKFQRENVCIQFKGTNWQTNEWNDQSINQSLNK